MCLHCLVQTCESPKFYMGSLCRQNGYERMFLSKGFSGKDVVATAFGGLLGMLPRCLPRRLRLYVAWPRSVGRALSSSPRRLTRPSPVALFRSASWSSWSLPLRRSLVTKAKASPSLARVLLFLMPLDAARGGCCDSWVCHGYS